MLLDAGADLMAHNNDCTTSLNWTATIGTPDKIKALVDAGANILTKLKNSVTALRLAAQIASAENFQALLSDSADEKLSLIWETGLLI